MVSFLHFYMAITHPTMGVWTHVLLQLMFAGSVISYYASLRPRKCRTVRWTPAHEETSFTVWLPDLWVRVQRPQETKHCGLSIASYAPHQ